MQKSKTFIFRVILEKGKEVFLYVFSFFFVGFSILFRGKRISFQKRDAALRKAETVMEICLYLLIFSLPFSKSLLEISYGTAFGLWIAKRIILWRSGGAFLRTWKPFSTFLSWPIATFFVCGVMSTITSTSLSLSLEGLFLKLLEGIMIYFVIVETIDNKTKLNRMMLVILGSIVLITANGMYQLFTGAGFLRGYAPFGGFWYMIQSSFGNPNSFGAWLTIMIPVVFSPACFLKNSQIKERIGKEYEHLNYRLFLWGLFVVMLISLILSYARGAWIGVFVALIITGILKNKKIAALVLLSGLVFFLIAVQNMAEGIKVFIDPGYTSRIFRFISWREALNILQDFPLFGSGLNTYATVVESYRLSEGTGIYPHNSYLQMAAEMGILGISAFMLIIFGFFYRSLKVLKKISDEFYKTISIGLISGLAGFLTHSIVDNHFYTLQLSALMWFVMGLVVSIHRVYLKDH